MPVRIVSAGGGGVTLSAASTGSEFTATLPANTGTVVTTASSAAVTPAMLTQPLTLGTAQASTSGTSIDFTGIPSWARRVTVMFNGVSTNGTSFFLLQVGAGSITTTGYAAGGFSIEGTNATTTSTSTAGFLVARATVVAAAGTISGHVVLTNLTGNLWVQSGLLTRTDNGFGTGSGGTVTLGGALDRVRITTVAGTDVFDAGSINIMYEG